MNGMELIRHLETKFPVSYAVNWDNVGLQAGRREKNVERIFVALDATDEIIEQAVSHKADMLLTHHPMLMSPVKKVNSDDFIGRRFIKLIQNDMICYSMHTNYDVLKMAELSAEYIGLKDTKILEITYVDQAAERTQGFGRMGLLKEPMTLRALGQFVKEAFGLESVKIFGELEQIVENVAISPGSGKSMIEPAVKSNAQVLISGDIGHHEGLDAAAQGLAVIDAGHYGLEHIFINDMAKYLREQFPEAEVFTEDIKNPFSVLA